jgi:hypothetical protein
LMEYVMHNPAFVGLLDVLLRPEGEAAVVASVTMRCEARWRRRKCPC